jgi:RecA-family ATPase
VDIRERLNSQSFLWKHTDLVSALRNGTDEVLDADRWIRLADRTRKRFRAGELDWKFSLLVQGLVEIGVADGIPRDRLVDLAPLALTIGPEDVPKEETGEKKKRWKLNSEIEAQPQPDYLIDTLLPEKGVTVIYGPPGSGKSFLVMDWAWSLQSGVAWGVMPSLKIRKCQVIYVCQEGQEGLPGRALAWKGRNPTIDNSRLCWIDEPIFYEGYDVALEVILEAAEEGCLDPPQLVIFDTMAACMAGDENLAKDQKEWFGFLEAVRGRLKCAILLIHHSRRADSQERGSGFLRGRADAMFKCEKDNDKRYTTLTTSKAKEFGEDRAIRFALLPVKYSGMKHSSCVLQPYISGAAGDILRHCEIGKNYSVESLAKVLKHQKRTVQLALRSLEDKGLMRNLSTKPGKRSGGRWQRV